MEKDEKEKCRRLERRENAGGSGQTELDSFQWLYIATRGIRFKPDRAAVRRELEAHLEDKRADLQRIFPDLSPEEAERRAVASMGDAWQVRERLARIHKPWLGYLWVASKWAAVVLVLIFLTVNVFKNDYYQSAGHPLGGYSSAVYGRTAGEKIRVGGYTFQIVGAAFVDYPEDSPYADGIQIAFRVFTPRFWEKLDLTALQEALTLTAADGQQWKMDRGEINMKVPEDGDIVRELYRWQMVCGLVRASWTPFSDTYVAYGDPEWQEGDWACLDFDFGAHRFSLTADQIERVVVK